MYRALLLAFVLCSANAERQSRIYRGNLASIEQAPYMVSIYQKSAGTHICGGSIISPEFVLTASHCIDEGSDPSDYRVRVGSTEWKKGGQERQVDYFVQHEGYNGADGAQPYDDVALLRVSQPFDINNVTTRVVEMFDKDQQVKIGQKALLAGWGLTEYDILPTKLKSLPLRVISMNVCEKSYADYGGLYENQFCATYPGNYNKEFCHGDSGSPLIINGKQAGLVSYSGPGCAEKGRPGVYTEVGKYRDWIDQHIKSSTTTG